MIRWYYKKVLMDLEYARAAIVKEQANPTPLYIPETLLIQRSGHSAWIVNRAKQWEATQTRFG